MTSIFLQKSVHEKEAPSGSYAGLLAAYKELQSVNRTYQEEIARLQKKKMEYEAELSSGSNAVEAIRKELDDARFLAGLTPVRGPGVVVTLRDSDKAPADAPADIREQYLIHDYDIRNIINELKAAGAEAIAINKQRVIATTAVRCVGPVTQVNGVEVGGPFVIRATGDPDTLESGLRLPGGVADLFAQVDAGMVKIEKRANLELPAYTGPTRFEYTHRVGR